ncbi:centrosomal protein of 70 kDa [Nematostella vectensis]|uniref:centrosomal protein of 70 kDa n=1 Tax=Nematostella vectensis TaxID=45351 RepID=UPI00207711F6|nr:centrosomal protein of 70 kDa [Nematostella vectensis]
MESGENKNNSEMLTLSGSYGDEQDSSGHSPRTSGVISDWSEVNRQLRHHGFHAVMVLPRQHISEIPAGAVILEEHTSQHLRHTLESLMSDCDRRQALVQELISASNRLQKDNKENAEIIYSYETEIRGLEQQLETERIKVQEYEDRHMSELHRHGEEVQDLQLGKDEVAVMYKQMEQKLQKKDEETSRLQKRCHDLVHKEEERLERQRLMFKHFKNRSPRKQSDVDQRILDIVDSYEAQIDELKEEMEQIKKENKALSASYIGTYGDVNDDNRAMHKDVSDVSDLASGETSEDDNARHSRSPLEAGSRTGMAGKWRSSQSSSPASSSPRRVKELTDKNLFYERQLKDAKKLIRLLENENTNLKVDLQSRPRTEEWKKTRKYNKKLEKLLAQNNLSPPRKRHLLTDRDVPVETKRCSTNVGDIEFLPIDVCREYIKEVCSRLEVTDLKQLTDRLDSIDVMAEAYPSMEKLISDILSLTQEKGALVVSAEDMSQSVDSHALYCQRAWQNILPTLRLWHKELKHMKDLQTAVDHLAVSLMPWKPDNMFRADDRKPLRMRDLRARIESLAYQGTRALPSELRGSDKPSAEQLQSIVAHFQKLFDVTSVSGVFPRMNELYLRVGEVYNAMNTMRELLNLDPCCKASDVVNAVGKLSKARHLLKVDDLPGLIQRLEQYDEFFPAFQEMVTELCRLLTVEKMDEIVTAVRALIKFPQY